MAIAKWRMAFLMAFSSEGSTDAGFVFMFVIGATPGRRLWRKQRGTPSAKQSHTCVTGSVEVRVSEGAEMAKKGGKSWMRSRRDRS